MKDENRKLDQWEIDLMRNTMKLHSLKTKKKKTSRFFDHAVRNLKGTPIKFGNWTFDKEDI